MDRNSGESESINHRPILLPGEGGDRTKSIDGKGIKIGEDTFRLIREGNFYYVDKSALIDAVLKSEKRVFLFTRPRRFGKSLNISMLDEYLNLRYADGPDLFEGLDVSRLRPDDPEKHANPVIRLDLTELRSTDYDDFAEKMASLASDMYNQFDDLASSDRLSQRDRQRFMDIWEEKASATDVQKSLRRLTEMIDKAYGRPAVILIDEYDNAVNEAASDSLRQRILGSLSVFLSKALKSNPHLRFAVLTGIAQITQASIFSGMNMVYTDSVFDSCFGEYWGFTEDEVRRICRDFGDEGRFEEAKEWYDGYRFGNVEAYNPWSVLYYVDRGFVPDTYWANNSSNSILNRMFLGIDEDNFQQMIGLLSEGSFETELPTSLTYHEAHDDRNTLYSLMAMTGYLRVEHVEGKTYKLSFPDKEVMDLMERTVRYIMLPQDTTWFRDFCTAVLEGRTDDMEDALGKILVHESYWKLDDEKSYEAVIAAILSGIARYYRVRSEQEGGNGRMDIVLESKRQGRANIIFELKKVDSEKKLKPAARKGLEQIHEKRYYLGMEGTVLLYGISFWGKVPCMEHDRVELPLIRRCNCLFICPPDTRFQRNKEWHASKRQSTGSSTRPSA